MREAWLVKASGTEAALLAAIVVTGGVLSFLSPYFFTLANMVNLLEAYSVTTILAAGAFVVLVSGGIDVSFTATAAATQYLAAYLAAQLGLPAPLALGAAALLGIALGAANALLTHYLRVASIIVTIATSSIYYAGLIYVTNAEEIYNLPDWWSARAASLKFATASGIVRVTLPILVMIVVVALTEYLMRWSRVGRQIYAVGGNLEAAGRAGVNVALVQLIVYGYLGFLAAVAGFVQASRVHQAVPTAMAGQELNVLAVAILGGASLVGGKGSMLGVVLAVFFLAMLQNGLNLVGVSHYFFGVVIGLAILVSTTISGLSAMRAGQRRTARLA